jgi:heterodisulfide reductase subunit B2
MSYSFYPGCSLHSTGLEYHLSTQSVFKHLGLDLVELADWNCCGASSAHALDHTLALALPARTLALAQAAGGDLVTPCAACFNRIRTADYMLKKDQALRAQIEAMVGFEFTGQVSIRPVLGVLYEDYGLKRIAEQVRRPLTRLKVVTYYGCLLVRPVEVTQFDDPDDPRMMRDILNSAGAEVMPWAYATECCGGSLSLSRADVVQKLVGRLVERAHEAGAAAMVTACPLCQVNLEMRQVAQPKMPVFYFTELLGLAFDLPETKKWWKKHLIDPRPVLKEAGLMAEREAA